MFGGEHGEQLHGDAVNGKLPHILFLKPLAWAYPGGADGLVPGA